LVIYVLLICLLTIYFSFLALSIFFFSDGRSTDHMKLGVSTEESYEMMKEAIVSMVSRFEEDTLTVSMVGLGDIHDPFRPLQIMADAATSAGAKGSFERCAKTACSISSAISSMVTSTTETRVALQEGGRKKYTERSGLTSEKYSFPKCNWKYFKILEHYIYHPQVKQFQCEPTVPLAAAHSNPTEAAKRIEAPPRILAVNSNYVGKGAERVAFRCRLSDTESVKGFVFEDMVAKETKYDQRIGERVAFHEEFAATQDLANYLAHEFNKHLQGIDNLSLTSCPRLRFLSCSVLLLEDSSWPTGKRGVLVEKMLDTERFPWTKWNDNNGGLVNGKQKHMPMDVDFELKELQREKAFNLDAIAEDEDVSDDDESLSDMESDGGDEEDEVNMAIDKYGIDPSDYLREYTQNQAIASISFLKSCVK